MSRFFRAYMRLLAVLYELTKRQRDTVIVEVAHSSFAFLLFRFSLLRILAPVRSTSRAQVVSFLSYRAPPFDGFPPFDSCSTSRMTGSFFYSSLLLFILASCLKRRCSPSNRVLIHSVNVLNIENRYAPYSFHAPNCIRHLLSTPR